MLKNELWAYSVDTLANLSETEWSAIREFANTLEKEMTSPEKCLELYEAVSTVNANWAGLTNTVDLSPVEKEKITSCTRAIILTQMRSKGMSLTVNPATNAVEVANEPTTWTYPAGKTETQFLTDIGLNTPAAAKKALDESEHFMRAAATMATRTATGHPGSININTASATAETSTGPDWISRNIWTIPYVWRAIDDARIDHPVWTWIGAFVIGSLALIGLYKWGKKLFWGSGSHNWHTSGWNQAANNHAQSHSTDKERGIFKTAVRNLRIGLAEKTILGTLLVLLWVGGYAAYKWDVGDIKSKVNGFGWKVSSFIQETIGMNKVTGAIDGVKQEIEDIKKHIPGMPARPSTPPVTPPSGPAPTPPVTPPSAPSVLPEIQSLIDDVNIILPSANVNKNTLLSELKKGPSEALKALHNNSSISDYVSKEWKMNEIEKILSRWVALKEATSKAKATPNIELALEAAPAAKKKPTAANLETFLQEKIDSHWITADMEWEPATKDWVEDKLKKLKKTFNDICMDDAIPPASAAINAEKKAILEPLWRKIVYDIVMQNMYPIIEDIKLSSARNKTQAESEMKILLNELDTYLSDWSAGWLKQIQTKTSDSFSISDIKVQQLRIKGKIFTEDFHTLSL